MIIKLNNYFLTVRNETICETDIFSLYVCTKNLLSIENFFGNFDCLKLYIYKNSNFYSCSIECRKNRTLLIYNGYHIFKKHLFPQPFVNNILNYFSSSQQKS